VFNNATPRIKYKLRDNNRSIWVDTKRFGDANVEIQNNETTNTIDFTYEDALSLSGMSTTETQKREGMIRVKESEIVYLLKRYEGIDDAQVILSMPDTRRFITADRNAASAAVTVYVNGHFTARQGETLARIVANAVEGLLIENVEVTDQNLNVLYSSREGSGDEAAGGVAYQRAQELKDMTNALIIMLKPLFSEVNPSLNLVYNDELVESRSQEYRTAQGRTEGFPMDILQERSSFEGSNPGDEPGLGSNDYMSPDYQTGSDSNSRGSQSLYQVNNMVYDVFEKITTSGHGSYLREESSVAVLLVNNRSVSQTLWMNQENRTKADWDEYKENLNTRRVEDPDHEELVMMVSRGTGIPPENVSVVVFDVFFPIDDLPPPIALERIIMLALASLLILMLALGLIRRKQEEEQEEEPEPELSVEELLVNTQLEEAQEEADRLEEINYNADSEIKKQIEKFIIEKPEAVASLLRNWINNEEW
jgi:flagellar M-ring protein FliF